MRTDSWTEILYPVHSMQEEGYCLVPALAWDGDGLTHNINEISEAGIVMTADAGVVNMFDSMVKKVYVEIASLPAQDGIQNPIPAKFSSAFSKESPYLKSLARDLGIRGTGIGKCQ